MRTSMRTASLAFVLTVTLAAAATAEVGGLHTLQMGRRELVEALEIALQAAPLKSSRVGVHVQSLATGEVIYAHRAEDLLNPASNVKLVTAAAALSRLGPEYRFPTEFYCRSGIRKGTCDVLYIRGKGDPALITERVYGIVSELALRGMRRVGDIVVDESYFDHRREGPGWEEEEGDRAYMAPTGAVSVNRNVIGIFIGPGEAPGKPARVEVEPASDFFRIDNRVVTVSSRSRGRLIPASVADGDRQRIVVSGRWPDGRDVASFYRKIDNPPMYAGETFKALLRQRGVAVTGRVSVGVTPENAVSVYTAWSPPLMDIVRDLNKYSNNFIAEQILKSLGAEVYGVPGSWQKGVAATAEYLEEIGIPRGSYVMKNGSGLNDTNRFSPAQMTRLLSAVAVKAPFFPEFASSLGVAGRDGTIRLRFDGTPAAGRLRGKTGTLENVSALSGYVRTVAGEMLAYSVLVNDFPGRHRPVIAAIDQIAATIAGGGWPLPQDPPAMLAGSSPVPESEVRARVATYAHLARLGDPRNLSFLRTALRTERDPVLRAVVADAIYRCEPESGLGILLENVPTDVSDLNRLQGYVRDLPDVVPLLSSLLDIAADGHAEALDKLLFIAAHAPEDETAQAMLAEGLQEVGRTAPDELLAALERAPEPLSDGAMAMLELGISRSEERADHPFMERLKETAPAEPMPVAIRVHERIVSALKVAAQVTEEALRLAGDAEASSPPVVPETDLPGGG